MYKRLIVIILPFIIIGLIGLALVTTSQTRNSTQQIDQPRQSKAQKYHPLSITTFKKNRKIQYAGIIYYAINDVNIQRWQEVSDVSLGWQVELSQTNNIVRYLVWPDKKITSQEKQLTPNWFEINDQQVIYHSFEVHTAQKDEDQHYRTSESRIVNQINSDHAAQKVRRMSQNVVIKGQHR